MKILQIIYSLSSGGAERFLTDLTNELAKNRNCNITILTIKSEQDSNNLFYRKELSDNIRFESLGFFSVNISIFIKLYKYIKKNKPDIVHIHLSPIIIFCSLAILLMRKTPFIETLHNEVSRINNSNKIYFFLKRIIYRFDNVKVCTISDKNAREFKRVYGLNCDALIYNGRKRLEQSEHYSSVQHEIENYKWNKNTIVVTHIGRCAPQKNQDLLIAGFNNMLNRNKNIILLIIGNGFESAKGLELKSKAKPGIFFLGEKHNIQDYLACSDAFCLSSLYEGMPITLIEAIEYGCIPLSTPVSGITDLIIDEKNGFISKDFTLSAFIDMLENYIKNRESINRADLIRLYNQKLSIESCAQSYYNFYESCLYD